MTTPQQEKRLIFATAPYLNAQPLIMGLSERGDVTLISGRPSELADKLIDGTADAALVPIVDCIFDPELVALDGLCVAADGPVLSVLIASHKPLESITCVAGDPESHTSNLLASLLLTLRHVNAPVLSSEDAADRADATVIIGDRALMLPPSPDHHDLAELWKQETGLPFVFAVWACRRNHPEREALEQMVLSSFAVGERAKPDIAERFSGLLSLPAARCLDYLDNRIRYRMGPKESQAIDTFTDLLNQFGLKPESAECGEAGAI